MFVLLQLFVDVTVAAVCLLQLFVDSQVKFCGQPVGLVVADTREIARRAAGLVTVQYSQVEPPVLSIKEALKTQPHGRE